MENNAISDGQISASSQIDDDHGANQARLHFKITSINHAGWTTLKNDLNQWLQLDLGAYTIVTRVATQGGKSVSQWVTKYTLQYSDDRFIFQPYQEATGNSAMVCFNLIVEWKVMTLIILFKIDFYFYYFTFANWL